MDVENSNKRQKYTIEFKCNVLKIWDSCHNATSCERKTGLDRKIIGEWVKQREILENADKKRESHRIIQERPCHWPELEQKLYENLKF